MNRKTHIVFLLIFLLFSCTDMETIVDLEVPPHDPVLVLNGLLDTDLSSQVTISHSVGAFSGGRPSFLQNASVLLFKNNSGVFDFIDSLTIDWTDLVYVYYYNDNIGSDSLPMYYYKSSYIPEPGSTYRIDVTHQDYIPISSTTYIPNDIEINIVEIDTTSSEDKIGLTFSFNDNINQQNYYRLKIYSSCIKEYENEYGEIEEWGYRGDAYFMSNDPSFPGDIPFEGYTFQGNDVTFTDALFNGQEKTISLDIENDSKPGESAIGCDTLYIRFSTFSDDTYSYYNSLGDHREKGELGLFGGEVIPVYSNVQNGLGVLISTNAQKIYLKP